MRVTSKGQVTIPIALRRKYGITPDVDLEFEETERGPRIVVRKDERVAQFRAMLERMRGAADFGMSSDEYMRFIRGDDEFEDLDGLDA